eukprot:112987_1
MATTTDNWSTDQFGDVRSVLIIKIITNKTVVKTIIIVTLLDSTKEYGGYVVFIDPSKHRKYLKLQKEIRNDDEDGTESESNQSEDECEDELLAYQDNMSKEQIDYMVFKQQRCLRCCRNINRVNRHTFVFIYLLRHIHF